MLRGQRARRRRAHARLFRRLLRRAQEDCRQRTAFGRRYTNSCLTKETAIHSIWPFRRRRYLNCFQHFQAPIKGFLFDSMDHYAFRFATVVKIIKGNSAKLF